MNKTMIAENLSNIKKPEGIASRSLENFFSPRSVAVIGASPKPDNQGGRIVKSLEAQGYEGTLITVHPRGEAISPHPCVFSVNDLPKGMDLAIAAVPAKNVPALIEPLSQKGIHHLVVISGGFAETGEEGRGFQDELQRLAALHGVRVIGPNGLGVFSAPDKFNSFFLSPEQISLPEPGPIALISQSGAFMSLILDRFARQGIGVRRAVNFGNRVDVGECELLEAFADDPEIRVIGIYLESVQEGTRFVDVARQVGNKIPIVIWKGGHFAGGTRAAQAHSASLAGSYEVFQAACAKAGLIEILGIEEFTEAVEVLAVQPPANGNRTLIVSNGGGMGVFLTDFSEKMGLVLPEPSKSIQDHLKLRLPSYYSLKNPIDLTGSGTNEQCAMVVEELLVSGEFDCLLMVLLSGTEGITPDIAKELQSRLSTRLPMVVGAYEPEMASALRKEFRKQIIPVFDSAEAATRALGILVKRGMTLRNTHRPSLERERMYHPAAEPGWPVKLDHPVDEMDLKNMLQKFGVRIPRHYHLKEKEDLDKAIAELKFPLVLKAAAETIKHKTELKAVSGSVKNKKDLLAEWNHMSSLWPGAIWAEEQMPPGLDLMVGAHRDPQFGPVLVFGTGGQYVELFRDVDSLLLPATDEEMAHLVLNTRAGRIIEGIRGEPPLNMNQLIGFLKLVADWMILEPRIESLDFNPVRLYTRELVVLDAKVTLKEARKE